MPIKFADLIEPATIFDRAAELNPRPHKQLHVAGSVVTAEFELRAVQVRLHPDLPPTQVWAYDGHVPGPTVVVDSGDHVHIRVRNSITTSLPYEHVVVEDGAAGVAMNDVGSESASGDAADVKERDAARDLVACCVTHLHGAPSPPDSDGWPENVSTSGEHAHHHYQFAREEFASEPSAGGTQFVRRGGAGPMFWYHDHAMNATRFNNYAGLAGVWIVRDPIEHALHLPTDHEHELPLILQDRNFRTVDGTPTGDLTGELLHKVQKGVRESFAPATVVSGKLWPRIPVSPRVYRLRLLNGSNARYFRLHFYGLAAKSDAPPYEPLDPSCIQQIGTDGGLLGAAVPMPDDGLVLAPAERADVLIDFGLVASRYRHVVVFNSAPAPYGNDEPPVDPWAPAVDQFRPAPQVMRFDLREDRPVSGLNGVAIQGMALDPDFEPMPTAHDQLPPHEHSLVALREEEEVIRDENGRPVDLQGQPVDYAQAATRTMLFLHEMMPEERANQAGMNMYEVKDDGGERLGVRVSLDGPQGVENYVTAAKRFTDATTIFIEKGAWHQWRFLNLSPDSHPMHIHLTQLQALTRAQLVPRGGGELDPAGAEFDLTGPGGTAAPADLPGWKDTFRVNPGGRNPANDWIRTAEMVTVIGQFKQWAGRYLYHCHILEHEDADMMRPFVVLPAALMRFMAHGGMAHDATTPAPLAARERKP